MRDGWETKTLGDVLEKTETVNPLLSPDSEFDYIDVSSISNQTFRIVDTRRLKGRDAPSRARRLVQTNDVLFATIRPTLQRVAMVPDGLDRQVCSTGYFVLRAKPGVDSRFLFYSLFTQQFMGQMEILQTGASYPAVTDAQVRAQRISLPPLPEQQRIVRILDEAFESIAKAKVDAEQNLKNAQQVRASYLDLVFGRQCDDWAARRLSDVVENISTGPFGSMLHKSDYVPEGIPLVNPINMVRDRIVPSSKMLISDETRDRLKSYLLKSGDVVVARRGELGRCALVTPGENGWLCGTGSFIVRLGNAMDGEFLVAALGMERFRDQLLANAVGTTMSNLNREILGGLNIPVPPILVQREMVARIRDLTLETNRLQSIYQQKLAALEELKKSLLNQAFSGELWT